MQPRALTAEFALAQRVKASRGRAQVRWCEKSARKVREKCEKSARKVCEKCDKSATKVRKECGKSAKGWKASKAACSDVVRK